MEIRPEEYSYVDAAINKGYSILTYDPLGTGKSEKPDAYDVVQIPVHIEILAGLTRIARNGKLISSSKVLSNNTQEATISDFQPLKVVHIGHSFGSFVISNMIAQYGNLSDGAILTAFLLNTRMKENMIDVLHYDHEFAKEHDPVRFGEYSSGYFVLTTKSDLQKLFFRKASLEPELLTYTERVKQPEAVGEYASEGTSPLLRVLDFNGPIQVSLEQTHILWPVVCPNGRTATDGFTRTQFFNGEFDNFVCKGDCRNIYDEELTNYTYPAASDRSAYLQPNTGHALTPSTNASAGFEVMLQYLDSQGL